MIVSPFCKKHDMAIRLLTISHCEDRKEPGCEKGECEFFRMRLYLPNGG